MFEKVIIVLMSVAMVLSAFSSVSLAKGKPKKEEIKEGIINYENVAPIDLIPDFVPVDLSGLTEDVIETKDENPDALFDTFSVVISEKDELLYLYEQSEDSYKVHEFYDEQGNLISNIYVMNANGQYELEETNTLYIESERLYHLDEATNEEITIVDKEDLVGTAPSKSDNKLNVPDVISNHEITPFQNDPGSGGGIWYLYSTKSGSQNIALKTVAWISNAIAAITGSRIAATTAIAAQAANSLLGTIYYYQYEYRNKNGSITYRKYVTNFYSNSSRTKKLGSGTTYCQGLPRIGSCWAG